MSTGFLVFYQRDGRAGRKRESRHCRVGCTAVADSLLRNSRKLLNLFIRQTLTSPNKSPETNVRPGESIGYVVSILSVGIQYQYLLQYLVFPRVLNQYFRRAAVSHSSILAESWQFWPNFGRFSLFCAEIWPIFCSIWPTSSTLAKFC